jgi:hypothetical protein
VKGALAKTLAGRQIFAAFLASKNIFFVADADEIGAYYSHTGLVLDDKGQAELNEYMQSTGKEMADEQAKEAFDFHGGIDTDLARDSA